MCSHTTFAEHIQLFLTGPTERLQHTVTHYRDCIRVSADNPTVPQTTRNSKGQGLTTLTPNYLCMQCTSTVTSRGRIEHGKATNHRFCRDTPNSTVIALADLSDIDSKNGSLFCQMCDDYVYYPTLEEMRIRKYGTGSLSGVQTMFMPLLPLSPVFLDNLDANLSVHSSEKKARRVLRRQLEG
jgi:ubiquitin carboxyl-terminal hydrolase 22/27/51